MVNCPACTTPMVKIDDSKEMFGSPPTPATGWYVCPQCAEQVVMRRETNAMGRGFPTDDFQRFVRAGKLTADGKLPGR